MLYYINLMNENPIFMICSFLVVAVIFVNGWTDAPNAIACAVASRALSIHHAILVSAIFNFIGVFTMCLINQSVAMTIYNIADFSSDPRLSLIALCAALFAIVLWAVGAWYFAIPTSESHALIAGISGAAVALNHGFSSIRLHEWVKVIYGIVVSVGLGVVLGFIVCKIVIFLFKNKDKKKSNSYFLKTEIISSAALSFMHGAQDGQKFIAVFLLGASFAAGKNEEIFMIPLWMIIVCSVVMALGTSIGGYRIIKSVGMDMVKLKPYQGVSADLASLICLIVASLGGLPVSTTHTKTSAIVGVGAVRNVSDINFEVVKELVYAWIFTFPGCGLLAYLISYLFILGGTL